MSPAVERDPDCTVVATEAIPSFVVITFGQLTDAIRTKLIQLPSEASFFKFGGNPKPLEILAADLYEYLGRRFLARSSEYTVDNEGLVIRLMCNEIVDPIEVKRHTIDYLLNRAGLNLSPTTDFEGER